MLPMTVKELYGLYESVNKDIAELKGTQSSIPFDREYSSLLKKSLSSEIDKFEAIRKSILELEIEIPVEHQLSQTDQEEFIDPALYVMF
jgi:hypothetical protein